MPFFLSPDLGSSTVSVVRQAIAHFEERTVLRFTPLAEPGERPDVDYILVRQGHGASSAVGMIGGVQFLTLGGPISVGNAIHTIGHAVGLWDEQSRADRDKMLRSSGKISLLNIITTLIRVRAMNESRPYDTTRSCTRRETRKS